MSAIDKAIEQLEKSVEKIREVSANESKAVEKAVRESSETARTRVESDYAATKKRLLKEARDAEKSIKDAIAKIEKAFAQDKPSRKRATKKAAAKPKRKAAAKPKAKAAKKTATRSAAKSTRKPAAKKKPAARKKPAAKKRAG